MLNRDLTTSPTLALENSRFMSRVYGWMTFGILLTGVIAYQIGQRPEIAQDILTNRPSSGRS